MATHGFKVDDLWRFGWADEPRLSVGGDRAAWSQISLDPERDEPVSQIMVAAADGTDEPRAFTDGPHDSSPRWDPQGRWLAYTSAVEGLPVLVLAPLEGGSPRTVTTPGPVLSAEWAPGGDRLVLVVNVNDEPAKNAPRVIRGTANRLDGRGWLDGRDHLFVYDLASTGLRQVTSGEYDHAAPCWSPDGSTIAFLSDRTAGRDDRIGRQDVWTVPAGGGRPRRLTDGLLFGGSPLWSPDGTRVAFTGHVGGGPLAGRESHLWWVPADRSAPPARVAPGLDRPTAFSLSGRAFAWLGEEELVFTVADRGTVGIARATLRAKTAKTVVDGDLQVSGLDVAGGMLAYNSAWVDQPAEVACGPIGRPPVRLSRAGDRLREAVRLISAQRHSTTAADGTTIEYWVMRPPSGRGRGKPPMLLDIHGGPELYNPMPEVLTYYQAMAAAGYLVVMPNPRGSVGFGEGFTAAVRGDWGGAPFDDIMACVDDVVARKLVDPARQFVSGYSYGGYMTSMTVGRTERFQAACVGAPVVDATSQFGTWDGAAYFAEAMATDPWSDPEHFRTHSPLTYVADATTPVFLHVNDGDLRCPPGQADELYAALKWFGQEVEYVRYPGGSHLSFLPMVGPPSTHADRLTRVLDFFARHGGVPTAS